MTLKWFESTDKIDPYGTVHLFPPGSFTIGIAVPPWDQQRYAVLSLLHKKRPDQLNDRVLVRRRRPTLPRV